MQLGVGRGRLAKMIADFARENGAVLNEADLAAHRCDWVGTVSTNYQGVDVHEIPPNGQGLTALLALNLIEHLPYAQTKPGSAERMHLEIECMRAAFADLFEHVADPDFMKVTAKDLLSKSYAKELGRLCQGVGSTVDGSSKRVKGTDTFYVIDNEDIPLDRRKEITYSKVVCKVHPKKSDPDRTHVTIGGNHICYPGNVGTKTAPLELSNS